MKHMQLGTLGLLLTFCISNNYFITNALAVGGIVPDGTVGISHSTKPLVGPKVSITEGMGSRQGGNLFHSFTNFNVDKGQTVTFESGIPTDNFISRVTGSTTSDIYGILKVDAKGQGNFYLINPNGITVGQGGQVNVPGSIHLSTADYLKLNNGQIFSAVNPAPVNALYSAEPAAFGFLGTSKANNGLLTINNKNLAVKESKAIDLISGEINVLGNSAQEIVTSLKAPEGHIRMVAMRGQGQVDIDQTLSLPMSNPTANNSGRIVVDFSDIDVSGNGSGNIGFWGGEVEFSLSNIFADNIGSKDATSDKCITIHSQNLSIDKESLIAADATKTDNQDKNILNIGDAGNIQIFAKDIVLSNNSQIRSLTGGRGDAGVIKITADTLTLYGNGNTESEFPTSIYSVTGDKNIHDNRGNSNGLILNINDRLEITNDAYITSGTWSQGRGGNIEITSNNISIKGSEKTGIFSQSEKGSRNDAGNVTITAKNLQLLNKSQITSSTFTNGYAGNILVSASESIKIDGEVSFENDKKFTSIIGSKTFGSGDAGNVKIKTNSLELTNGGNISTSSESGGVAGFVTIISNNLIIKDGGLISSSSLKNYSSGKTGNINITAMEGVNMVNGDIKIVNEATSLNKIIADSITPGSIVLNTKNLSMTNSNISALSLGNVAAGGIAFNAGKAVLMDQSTITTDANSGNGGKVIVTGDDLTNLKNSRITTNVTGKSGNGGDINITSDILLLETGFIQANTSAGGDSSGGNVKLNIQALIASGNMLTIGGPVPVPWQPGKFGLNIIQAAAPNGVNGQVESSSPQLNLSGELSNLGSPQFDNGFLSPNYCSLGSGSSLTRVGNGGHPLKSRDDFVY